MGAVVRRPEQAALGTGDQQLDQTPFGLEIDARRLAAPKAQTRLPERRATQLSTRLTKHKDHVARGAGMTGDRAIDVRQQPNHSDDGRGMYGSGGTFVIEGDVAATYCSPQAAAPLPTPPPSS